MTDVDPVLLIRNLLISEWVHENTSLSDTPRIHTGWYDYASGNPQVTVTNTSETVIGGGDTAISAGTGSGGQVQIRTGIALVNSWSGERDKLRGEGPDDEDVNPKQLAFEFRKEVTRILNNNDIEEFNSIAADGFDSFADTDGSDIIFRQEVPARYTYVERSD